MSLMNILDIFAIVLWVKCLVFAETLPSAFDSIITDPRSSADSHISRVSLAWKTMLAEEANGTLGTSRAGKVLFTNAHILGNILMLALKPCSDGEIVECSLAVPVEVAVVVTQLV